jgi:hypothetical protein
MLSVFRLVDRTDLWIIPMALGLTFPFTITVGMPVYLALIMRTS